MNERSAMVDLMLRFQFDRLMKYYDNVFLMEDLIHLMIDYYSRDFHRMIWRRKFRRKIQ